MGPRRQTVVVLLLNVFLASLVSAQYGSPVGNSNPGYGGTGTAVPSGDYGHKGQIPNGGGAGGSDGNSEPEPFNFSYQVKDAPTYTDFKHEANSDGKRVTGAYSVLLPDGRNQVVTYTADENGYNAKVDYEGEAKPQPSGPGGYPSPAPGGYPSPAAPGGYPSPAAPGGYPSPAAPGGYPSPAAPGGYPSPAAPGGYPSPAKGYPSPAPSYSSPAPGGYPSPAGYPSSGVKTSYAAPQPQNGGY